MFLSSAAVQLQFDTQCSFRMEREVTLSWYSIFQCFLLYTRENWYFFIDCTLKICFKLHIGLHIFGRAAKDSDFFTLRAMLNPCQVWPSELSPCKTLPFKLNRLCISYMFISQFFSQCGLCKLWKNNVFASFSASTYCTISKRISNVHKLTTNLG